MNAFVRQLAVLSVLWALCELLLPDGRRQQLVRMTVSLLMATALLHTAGTLSSAVRDLPALAQQVNQAGEQSYRRTALAALANQLSGYCRRAAERAGYEADVTVWLTEEGALERIEICAPASDSALMTPQQLAQALAGRLETEPDRIRFCLEAAEGT